MMFKLILLLPEADNGFITVISRSEFAITVAAKALGYPPEGVADSPGWRNDLRGRRKFAGLYGPMWDGAGDNGEGVIRWENAEAYAHFGA